jgi:hypothetical protein
MADPVLCCLAQGLYGSVDLGSTHLMAGSGHDCRYANLQRKIVNRRRA